MASNVSLARIQGLNDALTKSGVLRLRAAAELLQVSEMTIRRMVAANPRTFAYLGGYILKKSDIGATSGYNLSEEEGSNAQAKAAACANAATLIGPDDTIFVDCGTTLEHLATAIPAELPLTVVCYSLGFAQRMASRPSVRLFMLGGLFHASSASFAGPESGAMLAGFGITKAFVSAGGVDEKRGVSCSNLHEVPIKQQAIRSADRKYLVVDSSKFDRLRPALFAQLTDFDAIVSERGVHVRPSQTLATGLL